MYITNFIEHTTSQSHCTYSLRKIRYMMTKSPKKKLFQATTEIGSCISWGKSVTEIKESQGIEYLNLINLLLLYFYIIHERK